MHSETVRRPPIGARPGELMAPSGAPAPRITQFVVWPDRLEERSVGSVEELVTDLPEGAFTWVDVQGLGDAETLRAFAERYSIHPLALADLVNVPQRPKSEEYAEHHLFIVRMARLEGDLTNDDYLDDRVVVEQVGIVLGARHVLTFQEKYGDVLEPIRERLRTGAGRVCVSGADYLAYALIDTIVDGYFPILEAIDLHLQHLEDAIFTAPLRRHLEELHRVKILLIDIWRALAPTRDMLFSAMREENAYVQASTRIYLRDAHDHAVQLADQLTNQKETVTSLLSIYLSLMSQRTNEVMKVLTLVTSIFIPLSFVAGVYGMNFTFMPELSMPYAYPVVLLFMVGVAIGMLRYFAKQGWVDRDR